MAFIDVGTQVTVALNIDARAQAEIVLRPQGLLSTLLVPLDDVAYEIVSAREYT